MADRKSGADLMDAKELTDRLAREENKADTAAFDKYTVEPVKRGVKAVYESVVGTPEQNRAAADRMKARDAANPDSILTKMNKVLGYGDTEGKKKGGKICCKKKGGTVKSSASKRADGIAQRGKTRGRLV